MTDSERKKGLTPWEKTAIWVIVILVIIILGLVFRDSLEEYFRAFMEWYESKS